MALRKTFGCGMEEITGEWRKLRSEELHDLYCSLNVIGVWGRWQLFWWGNMKERDHWEDLGVDGRIILKWILNMMGGTYGINLAQVRCTWLLVANSVLQTVRVHKMRRISWVAEQLLASQGRHCSMDLVSWLANRVTGKPIVTVVTMLLWYHGNHNNHTSSSRSNAGRW